MTKYYKNLNQFWRSNTSKLLIHLSLVLHNYIIESIHECFIFLLDKLSHFCLFLQVNDLTGNKKHDDVTNRIKPMELPRIRGPLPDLLPPFNQRRDPPMAEQNEKNQTSLPILLRWCTTSKPRRQHKNRDHGPMQSFQKKMQASRMRFRLSKMLQTRPDHEVLLELNVLSPTSWRLLH